MLFRPTLSVLSTVSRGEEPTVSGLQSTFTASRPGSLGRDCWGWTEECYWFHVGLPSGVLFPYTFVLHTEGFKFQDIREH